MLKAATCYTVEMFAAEFSRGFTVEQCLRSEFSEFATCKYVVVSLGAIPVPLAGQYQVSKLATHMRNNSRSRFHEMSSPVRTQTLTTARAPLKSVVNRLVPRPTFSVYERYNTRKRGAGTITADYEPFTGVT